MPEANIIVEDIASTTPDKKIKVAHISGQLDESNVDEKIQVLYKILEENPQGLNLILDLENLEYMNSKSIGYLTDIYGKIAQNGGQVAIAKARPNIADILQVVGLTQLIKTFDSVVDASASAASAITASPQPPASPTDASNASVPTPPQPQIPPSPLSASPQPPASPTPPQQ